MDESGQHVADGLAQGESRQMADRAHEGGAGRIHDADTTGLEDHHHSSGSPFAEVPLLLQKRDLEALERAASIRGLTMGQLLRRLISNFLGGVDDARLPDEPGISTD